MLHVTLSVVPVKGKQPPVPGFPPTHVLVLVLVPPLQEALHADQNPHVPHTKSIKRFMLLIKYLESERFEVDLTHITFYINKIINILILLILMFYMLTSTTTGVTCPLF